MQSHTIINWIIQNPLQSPWFTPVMVRLALVLGTGLILVLLMNLRKLKDIHHSLAFKKLTGWAVMAPTFIISVMCKGLPALFLISFIVIQSYREYINLFKLPRFYFFALLGMWFVTALIALLSQLESIHTKELIYLLPLIYLISISLITILRGRIEEVMKWVTYTFFGAVWIGYSMMHFILIAQKTNGQAVLLIIGFAVALSDVCAYFIGNLFAKIGFGTRYVIAPNISSRKTWAGILGNITGAAAGILIMAFTLPQLTLVQRILLIILIGTASSLGDLIESFVKRAAHVKDASAKLQGHGGYLDRMDSLFMVIVVTFYYLTYFTEVLS